MKNKNPEKIVRSVVERCADCDDCRFTMAESCLFLPELYRLHDREKSDGNPISADEFKNLANLCNYCALCPCPDVRADIINAKAAYVERDGMPLGIRIAEDVARVGKICGAFPNLANRFLDSGAGGMLKKIAGIHEDRKIPPVPDETFSAWTRNRSRGLKSRKRKVAYFAGCTAGYFFPNVAKSAVRILEKNGIEVEIPDQGCCGMPAMLEGDTRTALKMARITTDHLAAAADAGYGIVCSCPTCGYMLKTVLPQGAYYSEAYQEHAGADTKYMKVPAYPGKPVSNENRHKLLHRSIYGKLLKDDGRFSSLSPMKRIRVAESVFDLGEYLAGLRQIGELKTDFSSIPANAAYFPPCHAREQAIGRPYPELLALIPDFSISEITDSFHCCGMAGIMGFKAEFHQASLAMGEALMKKIMQIDPERIVTDCLSCRMQFEQMLPFTVCHPIEALWEACGA